MRLLGILIAIILIAVVGLYLIGGGVLGKFASAILDVRQDDVQHGWPCEVRNLFCQPFECQWVGTQSRVCADHLFDDVSFGVQACTDIEKRVVIGIDSSR